MKDLSIIANGVSYPCYPTAGAMLRFKRKTRKEISEINVSDIEDTGSFLFCCACSSCRREDVTFPFKDEQEFLDCLMPEDINNWARAVADGQQDKEEEAGDEKKSHS